MGGGRVAGYPGGREEIEGAGSEEEDGIGEDGGVHEGLGRARAGGGGAVDGGEVVHWMGGGREGSEPNWSGAVGAGCAVSEGGGGIGVLQCDMAGSMMMEKT